MIAIDAVTEVIRRIGRIEAVDADQDIYLAGFASLDALTLLIELETVFEISLPDDQFVAARTPRSLFELVRRLKESR